MHKSNDSDYLFSWAKEISQDHTFWDFHAHPFCVISGNTNYQVKQEIAGLYSTNDSEYHSPQYKHEAETSKKRINFNATNLSESALLLSSRLIYTFSGPKVFTDYIDFIGISNIMLLPLARTDGKAVEMLESMASMFSADSRFALGCPLPVELPLQEQKHFFREAKKRWNIQSIKVHPNLSGIDPISREGKLLIYSTLENAAELKVPIVIHGGRTPGITPTEKREYGTLDRLSEISWSITSTPVVIAHCGCYGLEWEELDSHIRTLEEMLNQHPNLLVDTSGLDLKTLYYLMTKVDRKRFVFGSDALYFSVWTGWVTLLRVLTSLSSEPEDDLIQIASTNPQYCLSSQANIKPSLLKER